MASTSGVGGACGWGLWGSRAPARAYKSHRVALRKRLGQHLLKNADVVKNILKASAVKPTELVLEIGPGTGNMTIPLLQMSKGVFAVELDPAMHTAVTTRVKHMGLEDKFVCVNGDFLKTPLLDNLNVCVANIPYQISSPVVDRLLAYRPLLDRAVIMFQAEFAERMVAKPGTAQYCRLSVNMSLFAKVRTLMKIGREQFQPPPKVDSIVVEIRPRECNEVPIEDVVAWNNFLKVCFSGKNKTMHALLSMKSVLPKLTPMDARLRLTGPRPPPLGTPVPFNDSHVSTGKPAKKRAPRRVLKDEEDVDEEELRALEVEEGGGGEGSDGDDGVGTDLPAVRARVVAAVERSGLGPARPNAMSSADFLTLFRALKGAGCTFPGD